MKVKTSEATPLHINWAVAKCEGKNVGYEFTLFAPVVMVGLDPYEPSDDWAHGGPIIERERIELRHTGRGTHASYPQCRTHFGSTPLVAAMRCYVASKMGDEIEIPEELC